MFCPPEIWYKKTRSAGTAIQPATKEMSLTRCLKDPLQTAQLPPPNRRPLPPAPPTHRFGAQNQAGRAGAPIYGPAHVLYLHACRARKHIRRYNIRAPSKYCTSTERHKRVPTNRSEFSAPPQPKYRCGYVRDRNQMAAILSAFPGPRTHTPLPTIYVGQNRSEDRPRGRRAAPRPQKTATSSTDAGKHGSAGLHPRRRLARAPSADASQRAGETLR